MLLKNCRLIPELSIDNSLEYADILLEKGLISKISKTGTFLNYDGEVLDL